jgi:diguanylate cyclase (GGDEF)-like protein/PAS domain S-box-containing protein
VFLITKLSLNTIGDVKHVTELEIETEQIRSVKQRLETVLNNTAEGIITFYEDGTVDAMNSAAERLFGHSDTDMKGKMLTELMSCGTEGDAKQDQQKAFREKLEACVGREGEVRGHHKDGSIKPLSMKLSQMQVDGKNMYTGLVADITERKAMLDHFKYLAEHDDLTGLFNRSYFQQELEKIVKRLRRRDCPQCAVMYVDLDNFKYVNDTLGHAAGDRLVQQVGEVLNARVRETDVLARFGGDEFTVLLHNVSPTTALKIADSFRSRLSDFTFREAGDQVDIGCSIGIAIVTKHNSSADEVLSQADFACHQAKHGGRNRVRLFNPEDQAGVNTMSLDMGWSRRIKEAIDQERFVLACQPIVNTSNRAVECFEVLVRMKDKDGELIMPGGFLPSAERFGHMVDIDKWVIVNAIKTLAEQRTREPDMCYSINLSGQTLTHPGVCELVESNLEETGLDAGALTFEITETTAINDMAAAESLLAQLRSMGCKTALDDFGTGMSSFAYLKDLPVDIVKIDGRFVKNLPDHDLDLAMVKAMNDIAHAMGKHTVAEFVESEQAFVLLSEIGVDFGQGFYLGRPHLSMPCQLIGDKGGLQCVTHLGKH